MMRFIFVLAMLFCCENSLANNICKKGFEEEKYIEKNFRAISIFDKMIYLPDNFVPKYQVIKNNEFTVSYFGYSLDDKGFLLEEQPYINGALIGARELAITNFNDLIDNLNNKPLKIKCGDISIRSYYDSESLTEYTLIYTDVLALTYVSSIKGEWKKVLKNYLIE